ncbi:MAG: diguanylate cyclase [Chloroflexi bacterium]|nr:diguanylate cyclase [Chloroflexota bacterium]MBE3120570.1 diguanylate cyclase [Candidatus Atribacteria bacterium]MCX6037970.1 diguanylate cyclase [Chloroflexota bacterium]
MSKGHWVKELPAEIMVCDSGGIILEMNAQAEALFAEDGGRGLLGTNVLACHPQPALGKLEGLLDKQTANSYFNTENGEKRFFFQSPWYKEGKYAGFVEISFGVPEEIPHFIRE